MPSQRLLVRGAQTLSRGQGVLHVSSTTSAPLVGALRPHRRSLSSASVSAPTSTAFPSPSADGSSSLSPLQPTSLSIRRRDPTIDSILRVDHAGEYGAQCIYRGQLAALALRAALTSSTSSSPSQADKAAESVRVIEEMRDQEVEHLRALERLLPLHRARPTAFLPLWHVAGYALGYGTALLGVRAAMACTVAVEEVITEHYNDQLRTLSSDEFRAADAASSHPIPAEELKALRAVLKKHRDEEEHHRDLGIEHEAEQTPMYALLTNAIKASCHVAITIAKVV